MALAGVFYHVQTNTMTQTTFGIRHMKAPTPPWAKWMFRITFLITTAIAAWIAATNLFPQTTKYEITLFLKIVVDPIILGVSEMFGVKVRNQQKPE